MVNRTKRRLEQANEEHQKYYREKIIEITDKEEEAQHRIVELEQEVLLLKALIPKPEEVKPRVAAYRSIDEDWQDVVDA
jgi:hypothetical protein